MVDDQLDHNLHIALMRRIQERLEIVQRSIRGIHIIIVGDVVAVVAERRRKKGQEPDAGDSEVLQIIQPRYQPREITDAVIIRVGKGAHMEFVDDRVFVPERISCTCQLFHSVVSKLV